MKNNISKILGVVLTVVTLASVFVVAAPVSAATQGWSQYAIPSVTGMVLNTTIVAGGPIAQSADAKYLFAYVEDGAGVFKIVRSADNGRTWQNIPAATAAAVVEIICSPTEANVMFYITATGLFKTTTADAAAVSGISFTQVISAPTGSGFTALDVAKYSGRYIAVLGTTIAAITPAGVYFWDESDVFNTLVPVGTDSFAAAIPPAPGGAVLNVKMAPTFATDRTVVAMAADFTALTTIIRMNVNGGSWGAAVADVVAIGTAAGADATDGDIIFPSDFNFATSPIYFVAIADADAADGALYRIIGNVATAVQTADTFTNLSYVGSFASGTATFLAGTSAGTVVKSTNSGLSFSAVTLRSAAATNAWVLLDKNYATSKLAWILNVGAAQGALNVTTDGSTFNQWSLINDSITAIRDMAVATNGDIFMITTNGGVTASIYRNLVSASTPWERVYYNAAGTMNKLTLGADYATAKDVYVWTAGLAAALTYSTNSLNSFGGGSGTMATAPGTIVGAANTVNALYVINATTVVVGDNTGTIVTNQTAAGVTSAFWWTEVTNAPFGAGFTVDSIVSAGGTTLLAAASSATTVKVAKSTNNGITWTLLAAVGANANADLTVTVGGPAYVAAAADFATTGNVFVAASAGVFRYPSTAVAAVNGWLAVDGVATVATATGIVTAAGGPGNAAEGSGMVYVTDSAANTDVARIRGITATAETLTAPVPAVVDSFTGLQASSTAAGNVVLWTRQSTVPAIWTYTDTLGVAGTGVAVSNLTTTPVTVFGFVVAEAASGLITWAPLTNATNYLVTVNTVAQNNRFTAATVAGVTVVYTAGATSAGVTGMDPGTTYFVNVWAIAPVASFAYAAASFTTPVGQPTAPANLVPVAGATNVPVMPTFQWAPVAGATGYKLEVSTSPTFATLVGSAVTLTGNGTTAYVWTGSPLANNTSYYWRVQATLTGGNGAFVTSAFTTVAAAITPLPPVTITQQPAPTIVFPTAQPPVTITINPPAPTPVLTVTQPIITLTTPEPGPTPSYIWIIVGVGAVLTIAVIVLIIRTRRVV